MIVSGYERERSKDVVVRAAATHSNYEDILNDDGPASKRARSMFDDIMELPNEACTTARDQLTAEIELYLATPAAPEDTNVFTYWSNNCSYPTVKSLANKYLAILASSAPVERLFSLACRIFRADRCQLSDSTFHRLMNIRANRKYYD
jgi:hypothetical protein